MEKIIDFQSKLSRKVRRSKKQTFDGWTSMSHEDQFDELAQLISKMRAQLSLCLTALQDIRQNGKNDGGNYGVQIAEKTIQDCGTLGVEGSAEALEEGR